MQDLILPRKEAVDYISSHNLRETAPRKEVEENGRKYTQISLEKEFSALQRLGKTVMAVALIILTAGLALLFKDIRDLLSEGLSGKENIRILTQFPALEATMRVSSRETGYVGTEDDLTEWPEYWKHLTFSDGSALPKDPLDCVVKLQLLDYEGELPHGLARMLYLPYKALKGVKSGEKLNLLYKGDLVELEAKQLTNMGVEPFEEYLKGTKAAFKMNERTGLETTSYFSMASPDPLFFYTLQGGGTLFELDLDPTQTVHMAQKENQVLQEIVQDDRLTIDNCFARADEAGNLRIRADVPGTDRVDIVLNSKFIVFAFNGLMGGRITKFRWDIMESLKGKTMEEMKQALIRAEAIYDAGIVTLTTNF